MSGSVVIDCFPESAERYRDTHAIVAIDVIRATTTATTAVRLGRRVFPARTADEALVIARLQDDPLLAGEMGGNMPYGFEENNSPAAISRRTDPQRPMILVSSSGTALILDSIGAPAVYIACFRNFSAVARYIAGKHDRVAVLGAGTRGRFRREDQMGCAWVAQGLLDAGYNTENSSTEEIISRWRGASPEVVREGESAEYLRRSGQLHDLEFVLEHIDDLDTVPMLVAGELQAARRTSKASASRAAALHVERVGD